MKQIIKLSTYRMQKYPLKYVGKVLILMACNILTASMRIWGHNYTVYSMVDIVTVMNGAHGDRKELKS